MTATRCVMPQLCWKCGGGGKLHYCVTGNDTGAMLCKKCIKKYQDKIIWVV